jgi:hypothetical protein
MELKDYIYTEGKDIRIVAHHFHDDENNYPKPEVLSFTVGNGKEIFDKYGIPEEYQKVFFEVNKVGMKIMKERPQLGNMCTKKNHRFKGKEFLTDTEFYFAYNRRGGELFGYQVDYPHNYNVYDCLESSKEELFKFIQELRKRRIYDNYIKAIVEIDSYRVSCTFDKIEEEEKEIIKK